MHVDSVATQACNLVLGFPNELPGDDE